MQFYKICASNFTRNHTPFHLRVRKLSTAKNLTFHDSISYMQDLLFFVYKPWPTIDYGISRFELLLQQDNK